MFKKISVVLSVVSAIASAPSCVAIQPLTQQEIFKNYSLTLTPEQMVANVWVLPLQTVAFLKLAKVPTGAITHKDALRTWNGIQPDDAVRVVDFCSKFIGYNKSVECLEYMKTAGNKSTLKALNGVLSLIEKEHLSRSTVLQHAKVKKMVDIQVEELKTMLKTISKMTKDLKTAEENNGIEILKGQIKTNFTLPLSKDDQLCLLWILPVLTSEIIYMFGDDAGDKESFADAVINAQALNVFIEAMKNNPEEFTKKYSVIAPEKTIAFQAAVQTIAMNFYITTCSIIRDNNLTQEQVLTHSQMRTVTHTALIDLKNAVNVAFGVTPETSVLVATA